MAFPFMFERTTTTKYGETVHLHDDNPATHPSTPPPPPPVVIPREQLPHIAVKEAITAAADKAKELAASAKSADDLAKIVASLEEIENMTLARSDVFYVG